MSSGAAAFSEPAEVDARPSGAAAGGCEPSSLDRQLQMLGRLAEAGLEIAVAIERRVKAAGPEEPLVELNAAARAYDRVARAVRLSILLQSRVIREQREAAEAARSERLRLRQERTRSVERIVEWVAGEACGSDSAAAGRLLREAAERLDSDDIYGDVLTRPIGELVALVCRDLELAVDWAALSDEAWALDEVRRAAVGSPFIARSPPLAGEGDREAVERASGCDTG